MQFDQLIIIFFFYLSNWMFFLQYGFTDYDLIHLTTTIITILLIMIILKFCRLSNAPKLDHNIWNNQINNDWLTKHFIAMFSSLSLLFVYEFQFFSLIFWCITHLNGVQLLLLIKKKLTYYYLIKRCKKDDCFCSIINKQQLYDFMIF